jgi:hypothetical protein
MIRTFKDVGIQDNDSLTIKVTDEDGDEMLFKAKPTTALGEIFHAYCENYDLDCTTVRFFPYNRLYRIGNSKSLLNILSVCA